MDIYFNVTNKFHSLDDYFNIMVCENESVYNLTLPTDELVFVMICANEEVLNHIKSLVISKYRNLEEKLSNQFIVPLYANDQGIVFSYNGAKFKIVKPIEI